MDFRSAEEAAAKVPEEQRELFAAIDSGDQAKIEEELGDLLFSAVNIARFAGVDAEQALTRSTDKFAKRFRAVEALAKERGIDMKNAPDSLIDSLWEEIK